MITWAISFCILLYNSHKIFNIDQTILGDVINNSSPPPPTTH